MLTIQSDIINRYKEVYPNETLKETAERTGIHFVRIYRLFNNYEMKLSEYEQFIKAIDAKKIPAAQIHYLLDECVKELNQETLYRLKDQMLNLLNMKKIINNKTLHSYI